jgi:hypothetical protein
MGTKSFNLDMDPEAVRGRENVGVSFGSYCTLILKTYGVSPGGTAEYNPWDEDEWHASATTNQLESPDTNYKSSDGTFTVDTAGDYFIHFAPMLTAAAGGDTTAVLKIKNNGSVIQQTVAIAIDTSDDKEQVCVNTIVTLAKGDVITCTVDAQSSISVGVWSGSHFTMFKCNGLWATARYTAQGDSLETTDNVAMFDSDFGGTVVSDTNGVTFTASTGTFVPSATRKFLYFSSWIFNSAATVSGLQHKLCVDGSSGDVDDATAGATAAITPMGHTYSLIREVASTENASVKRDSADTDGFTWEAGSSFCLIDISNNGDLPSSYFCGSVTNDSNAIGTSLAGIFDEDNYSSFAWNSDILISQGITHTASTGEFTLSEAGDYLVILNLIIDSVAVDGLANIAIAKDGSAAGGSGNAQLNLESDYDPVSFVFCTIMSGVAGTTFTPQVQSFSADIDDGTSITIVRLGPRNDGATTGHPEFDYFDRSEGQTLIGDSNILDVTDKADQRPRRVEQAPARMNMNGPLNLRGRLNAGRPHSVSSGKKD